MIELKVLNDIVQNMINNIHDKAPEVDTKEGTFVRDVFIDPVADEISGLNIDMKLLEYSQSILTASGEDLDRLALNYNITRKTATKSNGFIRFYIKNINVDFVIGAQTQIGTQSTYSNDSKTFITSNTKDIYYVSSNSTMEINANEDRYIFIYSDNLSLDSTGYYYYDINATSELTGEIYNVTPNLITKRIDNLDNNILSFTNPVSFTGGTDNESDASLVLRIKLALQGTNIGTRYGYMSYILKQDKVSEAKIVAAGDTDMIRDINENGVHDGGKVDIYVKGEELKDDIKYMTINGTNTFFDGNYNYTNLSLENKPIRDLISISYKKLNDENIYFFKNANDFQHENIKTNFIKFDEYDFPEGCSVKQSIIDVLNNFNLTVTNKNLNYNQIIRDSFTSYGSLSMDSEYKYIVEYSSGDDSNPATIEYPFCFNIAKDADNNNVLFEFVFGMSNDDINYYAQYDYMIVKNKNNNNEDTLYIYEYSNSSKNYFKDTLLTYNNLFSVKDQNDEEIVYCDTINDSIYKVFPTADEDFINTFINYLLNDEVKNELLYNLSIIKNKLSNYKYHLDFGMIESTNKIIYSKPYIFVYNEIIDDYLDIKVNLCNNTNITNGYFNLILDNSNNFLNIDDYICDKTININNEDNSNITISYNFIFDIDNNEKSTTILEIKFKINENADFSASLDNVHLYTDTTVLSSNVFNSLITFYDNEINIDQFDFSSEKLILFNIKEQYIETNCYKIDVIFPMEYDDDIINIPITIIKKNDNLYIRNYYIPDYELVILNETVMGNSVNSIYRIKWFYDPLSIVDGDLDINISYSYNSLIPELQKGINQVKCLTADVLIKEVKECPIELTMNVNFDSNYDKEEVKNDIIDNITKYIDNSFKIGDTIRRIDIALITQDTDGVNYLDSCDLELRELYEENKKSIKLNNYQYFSLKNIIINEIQ